MHRLVVPGNVQVSCLPCMSDWCRVAEPGARRQVLQARCSPVHGCRALQYCRHPVCLGIYYMNMRSSLVWHLRAEWVMKSERVCAVEHRGDAHRR